MAEAQAIDRVHRMGQQRDVEVVRYVVSKSIELVGSSHVMCALSMLRNPALMYPFQYVRWIQIDKLRLIKDSLSPSEQKTESVNEVRWKVSDYTLTTLYLTDQNPYKTHRNYSNTLNKLTA